MNRLAAAALVLLLASACTAPPPHEARAPASQAPTAVIAQTAHPLATQAALQMLARGGNAIDAIVAAQAMLGLVEPQMSGVAGGTEILYWDAASAKLTSFDGLAAAPGKTTASLRTDTDGRLLPPSAVRHGGRSVGIPGTMAVLEMVHGRYGKLPWNVLFEPAIETAEHGFALTEYLHRIMLLDGITLAEYPGLRLYFDEHGKPLPIGARVRNPEYAATLRRIAAGGARGLLAEGGAERIVQAAQGGTLRSLMTAEDLRQYHALEREPVCGPFLAYRVCTVPPPSYGGIYLLQVLQMMEARAGGRFDFHDAAFVHLFIESGKLARADRSMYVGDPGFVTVPVNGLVDPAYVRERAASIDAEHARSVVAGRPPGAGIARREPEHDSSMGGTSQLTVADAAGDIVAMTTTINLGFGSGLMVDGFILNDVLVNFSAAPRNGASVANAMAPHKRPFTSMAPAIVFDAQGHPVAAGGSAGGGRIPDYVAQGWIEILANQATPAFAVAQGHVTTADAGKIVLEEDTGMAGLAAALRTRGQPIAVEPLLSGQGYIERAGTGWIGAADPRRGGNASGASAALPQRDVKRPAW
ncbi:MAG TPA: gamma-glutamyltransferase family protein [Usitatibacter sp.]|jgi:gamma-glutamyltranspeptidase/glutathione hydrolase|nr:gamma-glutamyltransferase family protein [Usitatibacter sp.]